MTMFGIGFPELIIIMVVALLVVGPSKLPELARSFGKAFQEFRRMADDVKESFEETIDEKASYEERSENQETGNKQTNETSSIQKQVDFTNDDSVGRGMT